MAAGSSIWCVCYGQSQANPLALNGAGTTFGALTGVFLSSALETDGNCKMKTRKAGTFKKLRVNVADNTHSSDVTVKLRVNGADSGVAVTIPAFQSGSFCDKTNTVTVAATDDVNLAVTVAASGNAQPCHISTGSIEFDTGGTPCTPRARNGGTVSLTALGVNYAPTVGFFRTTLTDWQAAQSYNQTKDYVGAPGTARMFRAVVSANTLNAATSLVLQVNGVDKMTLTIGAASGATTVTDLVTDVPLSPGDYTSWKLDTSGSASGAITIQFLDFHVDSTNAYEWDLQFHMDNGTGAALSTIAQYYMMAGGPYRVGLVEFPVAVTIGWDCRITRMQASGINTSGSLTYDMKCRVNGVDTLLKATIPISTGGSPDVLRTDTAHVLNLRAGSQLCVGVLTASANNDFPGSATLTFGQAQGIRNNFFYAFSE